MFTIQTAPALCSFSENQNAKACKLLAAEAFSQYKWKLPCRCVKIQSKMMDCFEISYHVLESWQTTFQSQLSNIVFIFFWFVSFYPPSVAVQMRSCSQASSYLVSDVRISLEPLETSSELWEKKITLAVYWISCNSDETLRKVKWFSVKDLFHLRNLCCQEVKLGAFWKKMPIFYNILQKSQPPLISLYFARKIRNHRRFIETRKWNETTLYKAKTEFVHY